MKREMIIYSNAAVTRLKNKRISVIERKGGGVRLEFTNINPKEGSTVFHDRIKNIIDRTAINLSDEAMEAIVCGYIKLKRNNFTKPGGALK